MMNGQRRIWSWISGTLLVAVSFVLLPGVLSAAETCSAVGMNTTLDPGVGSPGDGGPGTAPVPTIPATSTQAAIDAYVDNFVASGTLNSDPVPVAYPADAVGAGPSSGPSGSSGMTGSDAEAVLGDVYRHRLTDSSDTLQALMARDSEVAQAYQSLVTSGQLVTSAETDGTATLHHLSLLRNNGSQGGFSVGGNQVISIGVVPMPPVSVGPPGCLMNPGGFINWSNGRVWNQCMPNHFEEAAVYLTVTQPNGQARTFYTTSNYCDPSRSAYGFLNVPTGAAEVIVRPLRRCCQQGRLTYQLTCNPVAVIALACIPGRTNHMVAVTMGPWTPPGYYGVTTPGAHVWVADKDNACLKSGEAYADALGLFTLPSCLPAGDVYVYAESGGKIGRANVSDTLPCGTFDGPYSIGIPDLPRVSGRIRNWIPPLPPSKVGAMAEGCLTSGCLGGAALKVLEEAKAGGEYVLQSQLKPGRWTIYSYHDLGASCTNSAGHTVQWRCLAYAGVLNLEAGAVISGYDLPLPPLTCDCPL